MYLIVQFGYPDIFTFFTGKQDAVHLLMCCVEDKITNSAYFPAYHFLFIFSMYIHLWIIDQFNFILLSVTATHKWPWFTKSNFMNELGNLVIHSDEFQWIKCFRPILLMQTLQKLIFHFIWYFFSYYLIGKKKERRKNSSKPLKWTFVVILKKKKKKNITFKLRAPFCSYIY